MNLIRFLYHNFLDIAIVCASLALFIGLYKLDNRRTVKQIILDLVVGAEKKLGSGTGDLKYAYVMAQLYRTLPAGMRLLYSYTEIRKYIEVEVRFLSDLMSNGVNLIGYDKEHED